MGSMAKAFELLFISGECVYASFYFGVKTLWVFTVREAKFLLKFVHVVTRF